MKRRVTQTIGASRDGRPTTATTAARSAAPEAVAPQSTTQPTETDDTGARLHELPAALIEQLDNVILELVRDEPAELGPAMPAHILWGSKEPVTQAAHAQNPAYGRFNHVPHGDLLNRVHELIAAGRLQLSGDPRVLTPGGPTTDVR